MTPCPACAEHLETIRALGETCDRLVREREDALIALLAAEEAAQFSASCAELDTIPKILMDKADQLFGKAMKLRIAAITEMQRGRGVLPAFCTSSGGGARLHPPAEAGE